jgi:hypothetical protein
VLASLRLFWVETSHGCALGSVHEQAGRAEQERGRLDEHAQACRAPQLPGLADERIVCMALSGAPVWTAAWVLAVPASAAALGGLRPTVLMLSTD